MTALSEAIRKRNEVEAAIDVMKDVQKNYRPLSRVQREALRAVIALLKVIYKQRDDVVQTEKLYDPMYWS